MKTLKTITSVDKLLVQAETGSRWLAEFFRAAWKVLEPSTELKFNWHLELLCDHLEAVYRGDIKKLIINISPGSSKSLITSVMFPAWVWINSPHLRIMSCSYAQPLATRDAQKSRALLKSNWFQSLYGENSPYQNPKWWFSSDQSEKTRYLNTRFGFRYASSVGGAVTGERADILLLDDPHKPNEIISTASRRSDIEWLDLVWSSRKNDPVESREVVIMQRLHDQDATGYLMSQGAYEHLVIPMEYIPGRTFETSRKSIDPRKNKNDLMHPERFPREAVEELKVKLGPFGSASQLQQHPSPDSGGIFSIDWFRCWVPKGMKDQLGPAIFKDHSNVSHELKVVELPDQEDFEMYYHSYDLTFKDVKSADYVGGVIAAKLEANLYMLDLVKERLSFVLTVEMIRDFAARYPALSMKLVEGKANGPAVISQLQNEILGLVEVEPEGGKEARAFASTPVVAGGNWIIPHPKMSNWVEDYIYDMISFPMGASDDTVDATTQLIIYVYIGPQISTA